MASGNLWTRFWISAKKPDGSLPMSQTPRRSGSWIYRPGNLVVDVDVDVDAVFFPPIKLFQLTFEFPTTCFAGQTLLHLGKLRVPCRDVANPTGLQHSLNSCIRLHRVAIVATVAKDCMHSAPSTDLDVDSLLEVSRQRPLMAAIDGSHWWQSCCRFDSVNRLGFWFEANLRPQAESHWCCCLSEGFSANELG